jgi:oxygen-independent coproporphyrinogen-3 oxidase
MLVQGQMASSAGVSAAGAAHPLAGREPAGHPPVRSLYIHVPFCFHKCHYCDFYSIVDTQDRQGAFTDRLIDELGVLAPHAAGAPLRTVFVGGGTPSLLRIELWERLLGTLARLFDLSQIRAAGSGGGDLPAPGVSGPRPPEPISEFTVECNPETVTPELMALLKAGGVSRASVGAQSFNPHHLKTLERWHDPENVARALELARAAGIERRSLDLIYGVPGQTLEEWDADLTRALSLGTSHLSCYALTYEPNTAMTARLAAGRFTRTDEDLETDMFEHTLTRLRAAGLERYEVSNFARPGQESLHNLAYWRQEQWLAAGPSASGHAGGWRWKNTPRLGDYLASWGLSTLAEVEAPDARRAVRERLMTGLRLAEGVDAPAIVADAERAAGGAADRLHAAAARARKQGWLEGSPDRWRLTDAGFLLADHIASEFMRCV